MQMPGQKRLIAACCLALAVAATSVGCGSNSTSSSSESTAGGTAAKADVAGARAALAPYVGKSYPAFPVDKPLARKPDPSLKLSQLEFGSPYGALIASLLDAAAHKAGVQLSTVKAGSTASTVQSAAESIVTDSPRGVFLPAFEPSTISKQLQEMDAKRIPVIGLGVLDPARWGLTSAIVSNHSITTAGKVLADWAVATRGNRANVIFFGLPEVSYDAIMTNAFLAEMKARCPGCAVRTAAVHQADVGSTLPSKVVSELQQHPGANVLVFQSQESTIGLPAAMKAAGISADVVGYAGGPTSLQYIKNGQEAATLAISPAIQTWTAMDAALRAAEGQPLTAAERSGDIPMQILTQKDITFDPRFGWTSDPRFPATFGKLWHAG